MRLDDARGFVFDADGTLIHRDGKQAVVVPGAREVLERIRDSGRPYAVFTNGSHVPPEGFADDLREVGLPVADERMLTPLRSFLYYLERRHPGAKVRLFGTPSVEEYMTARGVQLVDGEDARTADVVFVTHVDQVDLDDIERAARAVLAGGKLLTGSFVPAYAGHNGTILSRGAMVAAALAKSSGVRPTIVGKPSKAAVAVIRECLGVPTEDVVVVGDDLGMDIALGHLGGSRTVLVRSGISGEIDLERVPERRRPHAVVGGVDELMEWL